MFERADLILLVLGLFNFPSQPSQVRYVSGASIYRDAAYNVILIQHNEMKMRRRVQIKIIVDNKTQVIQ